MSDAIKIGDFVHFHNDRMGYLETCGYERYESHFSQFPGTALVQTATVENRDLGSGTWQIVAAEEDMGPGDPVKTYSRIHLKNCYQATLGYLSLFAELTDEDREKIAAVGDLDGLLGNAHDGSQPAYVFTTTTLDKRRGASSFSLNSGDVGEDRIVRAGSRVTLALARTNYQSGHSHQRPDEYPPQGDVHILVSVGPLEELGMLHVQYPDVETGMLFTCQAGLEVATDWTVKPSMWTDC